MAGEDKDLRTVPENAEERGVLPKAIAVQIGDRDLWVGDGGSSEPANLDAMALDIDYVVSVNQQATEATTDFHPLSDARVNDQDEFDAAVEAVRERYRQDGTVLVHCAAGISRSVTVAAVTLAAEENRLFEEAVDIVTKYREAGRPHPKLKINAYRYLAAECQRDVADALDSLVSQVTPMRMDDIDASDRD